MPEFDVETLRARFPALAIEQDGRRVALFDGPGGTQVPDSVIEAVATYYRTSNANHDGPFLTSQRSDAVTAEARAALADLLNAADPAEIKFGNNMTSLTMHFARSVVASLQPGDTIVVTSLDHEANVGPWRSAAADRGLVVRTVPIRPDDVTLDIEAFDAVLHERPKLVAFGWASNAVGSINPVAELVRRAHEAGSLTFVDAVHAAPHLPIDVQAIGTDVLACSAYKFFGPHVGVLYGRRELLDALPTYRLRVASDRFETGTGNFEGLAGTLAAVEYLADVGRRFGAPFADRFPGMTGRRLETHAGLAAIRAYEMGLFGRLLDGLEAIPGVRVWGITDRARFTERTPTAAVTFVGHTPEAVATALGERGIATWWGNFYAAGVVESLGLEPAGVLRIGLTHYNTAGEVDRLLAELRSITGPAA
ncbi:MAG TPA: cysteine desulfurase-like protein [Candidatus Limnocylindrales bacterium]|nr:cysteine desulfurase-like protein [Candidatus Limnocylindrales bacterium]